MGRVAIVTTALLALGAQSLPAKCIAPPPPCEALKQSSIVLVADVANSQLEQIPVGPNAVRFRRWWVMLLPIEKLKGPEFQPQISIELAFNTEAVPLDRDKRYLIYANVLGDGPWQTGCTRTKPFEEAIEELAELRQCAKP